MSRFNKILIANRGEIAVRVMRSCKKLGYLTVAVYSDADREALHVRVADEAVHIGPSPAKESYLVIAKILAAARASGANAIHPGYGFLSENAAFAQACRDAGILFIGPSPEAIALMGNKRQAKLRMIAAGVPCIPGYQGAESDDNELVREAERVGFPIMVKAAAGGGGRGMRLVHEIAGLRDAIRSARSEAENSFGNGELILERAVIGARHVEIQVFADEHGNAVHLGERDCSVQRRHQKVVEESPSPAVDAELRARMGEVAVKATKAIGYLGAGTIEFLLAPSGEFFFMEMNTRLQVEHPVTEMITGLDLVQWQLKVAAGERLPCEQEAVRFSGHAIEVRLCAEDPANDFLPQTGRLLRFRIGEAHGVRVDCGVVEGQQVCPFYDSMQAKIIAHGATRDAARRLLLRALSDAAVLGVATNRDLLLRILDQDAFASGAYDTGFLAAHFPKDVLRGLDAANPKRLALAAVAIFHDEATRLAARAGFDRALLNWNSTLPSGVEMTLLRHGRATKEAEHAVTIVGLGDSGYEVRAGGETTRITISAIADGQIHYAWGDLQEKAQIARDGDQLWLCAGGVTDVYTDVTFRPPHAGGETGDGRLRAPMDGRILRVAALVGERVNKGQVLVVLEAMKMQLEMAADLDGTVAEINVSAGAQVSARQLLLTITPAPPISPHS